jgi:hypothetical protein
MHQDACQRDALKDAPRDAWPVHIVQSQFSLNRYTKANAQQPIAVLHRHKLHTVGQGAETEMVA